MEQHNKYINNICEEVCMYVYMYVYLYVCMYACVCVCVNAQNIVDKMLSITKSSYQIRLEIGRLLS